MPRGKPRRTEQQCAKDFWRRVEKNAANECWPWTGHLNPDGYGTFYKWRRCHPSHREAYRLCVGEIPEGLNVCHKCDNPRCCNPKHLFIGSKADNRADCVAKGRQARGEKNHWAKLTVRKVNLIRRMYRSRVAFGHRAKRGSGFGVVFLAKEFGVSKSLISLIVKGAAWKHVPMPKIKIA